ncbi:MAG: hypothetical protein ACTSO7_09965 [Candidatus Heimdallarchaeota archaeon]
MFNITKQVIGWLGEDDNPPVNYLTHKILLEETDTSKLANLKSKINSYKPIVEILTKQKEDTYWYYKGKNHNYKKYLGTFWQLHFLSRMHAEKNEQITNACEYIFSTGQAPNGGFSMWGTNSQSLICLTANMIRAFIHFGYLNDERLQKALEYLLSNFVDTNGFFRCRPIGLLENCYMTTPKILYALSVIPVQKRNLRIKKGIDLCVNGLLDNNIHMYLPEKNREWMKIVAEKKLKGQELVNEKNKFITKHSPIQKVAKAGWMKFGFPLSYNSDSLDALLSLTTANIDYQPALDSALALIKSKQKEGIWFNEKQYKSSMHAIIEPINSRSKWLTLHALIVMKHFKGLEIDD